MCEYVCIEERGGAHLWLTAFIVGIKHTVYSSGVNEMSLTLNSNPKVYSSLTLLEMCRFLLKLMEEYAYA